MLILGVDPGAKGALAFLDPVKQSLDVFDFGCELDALSRVRERSTRIGLAVVERVHAMPATNQRGEKVQGIASTFNFGAAYGWWRGVLQALLVPSLLVEPGVWKKLAGIAPGAPKAASVDVAERLFGVGKFRGPRGGALDGRADAALLAKHGARHLAVAAKAGGAR